jgi:sensor histidine kinase YesM
LKTVARNPVRIAQIEVLTLRQDREQQGKIIRPQEQKKSEVAEALAEITTVFNRQLEMVAESNRRNEENYQAQINQLNAEIARLRSRKWWQR